MKKPQTARSISSASVSSTGSQGGGHGLRSQIGHLLPKHALFQVHVYIDQLSNVPLMGGYFAVRWKFQNVQSGLGLLSKMKGGRGWGSRKGKGKDKAQDDEGDVYIDEHNVAAVGRSSQEVPDVGDSSGDEGEGEESSPQNATYSSLLTTSPRQSTVSLPGDAALASGSAPMSAPTDSMRSNTTVSSGHSVARGMTEWSRLQSYNVQWEQCVNAVVQMDVRRETGDLMPCELKLNVMQRVSANDLDPTRHTRLGKLYLNLAEYADAGPVTRRYLLRDSKTNATLKLTIELEHIGGEKHYKPPPLRKSEVLASVSGLLFNNELLQTSVARQLDAFTHSHEPPDDRASWVSEEGRVDETRLASWHGLHSTENLIEALFNPVPTSSETPSPFTYYVPPTDNELGGSDSSSFGGNSISADSASVGGVDDSNRSGESDAAVPRPWWRKIRPSTPIHRQAKNRPSTPSLPAVFIGLPTGDV